MDIDRCCIVAPFLGLAVASGVCGLALASLLFVALACAMLGIWLIVGEGEPSEDALAAHDHEIIEQHGDEASTLACCCNGPAVQIWHANC